MRARILRALAVAILLAATALSTTWGFLFYRPLPTIDGYFRLLGLDARGEVLRDVTGTPHVYAQDLHDLFFLQGYVTAQDRLAQMEAMREVARLRSGPLAERAAARAGRALRAALEAYAAGVNKLIAQYADARALPGELVLAGRRPAAWEIADSLAIAAAYLERTLPTSVCAAAPSPSTVRGQPILAADVYLDAPDPGWYMVGLEGGGARAVGASIPGMPGIVAGHNGWVAWAILSSARPGSDPTAALDGLLGAMPAVTARGFTDALRRSPVASCVADLAGRLGGTDRGLVAFVPADRAAVLGGDGGRGAALVERLERPRGLDLESMRLLLGPPVPDVAGARVLVDLGDVDTSRSALSQGISAQRASPHFRDQAPLWERGQAHLMPFSRPALVRTEGQLVLRAH